MWDSLHQNRPSATRVTELARNDPQPHFLGPVCSEPSSNASHNHKHEQVHLASARPG